MFASLLAALTLAAAPQKPSVLLVTLDTFRGDFVGTSPLGRSGRTATPRLDELAGRGVAFTRARASAPLTLPSHASILTGLYPPEHGVRGNGSFRLRDRYRTLAEALHESGYETAAFVASFVLDARFGLAQGFDVYDDDLGTGTAELESPEAERTGDRVLASFEKWLRSRDGRKPFFAWVHFYDPHYPYRAPEPFASRFGADSYAGEIAYTDSLVGDLLKAVPASTLIAVVGDHGEGLGEHLETTHSLLVYNSTIGVPMMLAGPGIPAGRSISTIARTIDLPATILDFLGLPPALGSGRSLRGSIEGRDEPSRTAYAESLYGFHHLGFSPLYALETGRYRFIEAPRRELYDVEGDPGESRDVLQEERSVARELYRALTELRSSLENGGSAELTLDAETREKLASLGYLPSRAPGKSASETLPDPKDQMTLVHRIQEAQDRRQRNDCPGVLETLGTLRETGPPVPLVYELLASCYLELGQWETAAAVANEALARGFESAVFHQDLGVAALRRGKPQDAEREFRLALALEDTSVATRHHLGDALRAQRRDDEAIRAYRDALALNPRYVYSWNGLGMSLSRAGTSASAIEAFRKVVELDPSEPGGLFNLAVQLDRTGARDEALALYRRFLEISSDAKFSRERARAKEALREPAPRSDRW
ncbi:MAG TPA: sulfatase-like hydrolase/transferase [Vicinamibacteria bacterium]|nr:sulfatase-like hydrolase/transferase [Vicinamibacteria bacterium]